MEDLSGTGLDAKLEAALKFFSATNAANGRLTQDALPEGSRNPTVSYVGFNVSGGNRTPSGMEFLKLVPNSNEGAWTVLQSQVSLTFTDRDTYVAIRRTDARGSKARRAVPSNPQRRSEESVRLSLSYHTVNVRDIGKPGGIN